MINFAFKIKEGYTPNTLSAIVGADSFFYGVFDADYNLCECHSYKDVVFDDYFIGKISNVFFDFNGKVDKIVTFTTKPFLHLPNTDEKIVEQYPAYDDKKLTVENLSAEQIKVVFGLSDVHTKFVKVCFPDSKVHHISSVMHTACEHETSEKVYLHVDENIAHIMVSAKDKLRYYNQFTCKKQEDFLYFILMVFDLFSYDPHVVELKVSGRLLPSDGLHDLLRNYIRNIQFTNSERYTVAGGKYSEMKHIYQDLYSTAVCES